jgi:hypothetical protein
MLPRFIVSGKAQLLLPIYAESGETLKGIQ